MNAIKRAYMTLLYVWVMAFFGLLSVLVFMIAFMVRP